MKKKVLLKLFLGFALGVFIAFTITLLISAFLGTGQYHAVPPQMLAAYPNELTAVWIQYLLSGLLGISFSIGVFIFQKEQWSMAKRTMLHFLVSAVLMFPIAYVNYWMEHSLRGFLSYFALFVLIYIIIWGISSLYWRTKIKEMNEKLQKN